MWVGDEVLNVYSVPTVTPSWCLISSIVAVLSDENTINPRIACGEQYC